MPGRGVTPAARAREDPRTGSGGAAPDRAARGPREEKSGVGGAAAHGDARAPGMWWHRRRRDSWSWVRCGASSLFSNGGHGWSAPAPGVVSAAISVCRRDGDASSPQKCALGRRAAGQAARQRECDRDVEHHRRTTVLRGWRTLVLREPRTTMRSHSSSSKSRSLRHRSAELDMARLDAAAREKAVSDACGGVRRSLELEEREQALQRAAHGAKLTYLGHAGLLLMS